MIAFRALVWRNCKLFFKDKGMFFSSLIAPLILLVLYATFLYNVYEDNFLSALPEGMNVPSEVIAGTVGSFLFSSRRKYWNGDSKSGSGKMHSVFKCMLIS